MELNKEVLEQAITANPNLVQEAILPLVMEHETLQTYVNGKADSLYKEKIGEEIKNVHSMYDKDMFEILGVKPKVFDDGKTQKTYDAIKEQFLELKTLKEKAEALNKDTEVQRLNQEIEKLRKSGGGEFMQKQLEAQEQSFTAQIKEYQTKLQESTQGFENYKKEAVINQAIAEYQSKLNPDIPKSVQDLALKSAISELVKSAKFENDNLVFLKADGTPDINPTTFKPKTALEMLESFEAIKDISLKGDNSGKGGNAQPNVGTGIAKGKDNNGNDVEKLVLDRSQFNTKQQFNDYVERTLKQQGITRDNAKFQQLQNQAYKEYNVAELPLQ